MGQGRGETTRRGRGATAAGVLGGLYLLHIYKDNTGVRVRWGHNMGIRGAGELVPGARVGDFFRMKKIKKG